MIPHALEELRFVQRADVWKAGRLAGTLERGARGEVVFGYLGGYDGPPIATTLPVSTPADEATDAGLPPFFAGLLPEGHRLTVLRRTVKTSPDDELSLLLAVGADVPGDVQVVPAGEVPLETPPLVPDDLRGADFRALTDAPDRHGIPGVQAKASATMLTVPVALARSRAILKVDPADCPHLVVNEAAHLAAARRLRIPVAEHSVVHDGAGVQGLLVDRFDRVIGPDGDIERLALEDAAQVMGILPAAKYAVDSEAAVLALASATHASKIAARNLYLQLVFAWLVGNGDLHAKNLSILQAPDGRCPSTAARRGSAPGIGRRSPMRSGSRSAPPSARTVWRSRRQARSASTTCPSRGPCSMARSGSCGPVAPSSRTEASVAGSVRPALHLPWPPCASASIRLSSIRPALWTDSVAWVTMDRDY